MRCDLLLKKKMEDLKLLKRFHGHLGPFAAVGFRMGRYAVDTLGVKNKKLKAEVYTGTKPPISCIIDGIQLASGCTLGKGNISVIDNNEAKAVFTSLGSTLVLKLKDDIKKRIIETTTHETEEKNAEWIYDMPSEELFDLRE